MKKLTTAVNLALLLSSVSRAELWNKRISFDASRGQEFYELCKSLDVICAIEVDSTVRKDKGSLEVAETAGRKALATVMALYPGHRWELREGVLFVYPKRRKEKSPLDQKLDLISLNNESFESASRFFTKEMRLRAGSSSVTGSWDRPADSPKISFEAKNIVIRDALTRIVKSHGHAMWIFNRYKSSDEGPLCTFDLQRYAPSPPPFQTK